MGDLQERALTLGEIIALVRDGGRPEYDDLRYAICALEALSTFDQMAFTRLAQAEKEGKPRLLNHSAQFHFDERFQRVKRALSRPPKDYVGWNNDPDSPEFLERRKQSIALYEKISNRERADE
jgi:hypothetical protein